MIRLLTDEMDAFLRENCRGVFVEDLTGMLNKRFGTEFSYSQIRGYMSSHHITNGMFMKHKSHKYDLFPKEIQEFIQENVKGIRCAALTDMVNERFGTSYNQGQMKAFKHRNHLSSGLTGRFEKGQESQNKGKKWDDYMPKESQEHSRQTCFKKGTVPHNHRPVGSERISVDGYVEVKVAEPKRWKLKHRVVWEEHNGPIPKGMVIIFLDGNKTNCSLDNLALIDMNEHTRLNQQGLRFSDKELTKVSIAKVRLDNRIRDIEDRSEKEPEQ